MILQPINSHKNLESKENFYRFPVHDYMQIALVTSKVDVTYKQFIFYRLLITVYNYMMENETYDDVNYSLMQKLDDVIAVLPETQAELKMEILGRIAGQVHQGVMDPRWIELWALKFAVLGVKKPNAKQCAFAMLCLFYMAIANVDVRKPSIWLNLSSEIKNFAPYRSILTREIVSLENIEHLKPIPFEDNVFIGIRNAQNAMNFLLSEVLPTIIFTVMHKDAGELKGKTEETKPAFRIVNDPSFVYIVGESLEYIADEFKKLAAKTVEIEAEALNRHISRIQGLVRRIVTPLSGLELEAEQRDRLMRRLESFGSISAAIPFISVEEAREISKLLDKMIDNVSALPKLATEMLQRLDSLETQRFTLSETIARLIATNNAKFSVMNVSFKFIIPKSGYLNITHMSSESLARYQLGIKLPITRTSATANSEIIETKLYSDISSSIPMVIRSANDTTQRVRVFSYNTVVTALSKLIIFEKEQETNYHKSSKMINSKFNEILTTVASVITDFYSRPVDDSVNDTAIAEDIRMLSRLMVAVGDTSLRNQVAPIIHYRYLDMERIMTYSLEVVPKTVSRKVLAYYKVIDTTDFYDVIARRDDQESIPEAIPYATFQDYRSPELRKLEYIPTVETYPHSEVIHPIEFDSTISKRQLTVYECMYSQIKTIPDAVITPKRIVVNRLSTGEVLDRTRVRELTKTLHQIMKSPRFTTKYFKPSYIFRRLIECVQQTGTDNLLLDSDLSQITDSVDMGILILKHYDLDIKELFKALTFYLISLMYGESTSIRVMEPSPLYYPLLAKHYSNIKNLDSVWFSKLDDQYVNDAQAMRLWLEQAWEKLLPGQGPDTE